MKTIAIAISALLLWGSAPMYAVECGLGAKEVSSTERAHKQYRKELKEQKTAEKRRAKRQRQEWLQTPEGEAYKEERRRQIWGAIAQGLAAGAAANNSGANAAGSGTGSVTGYNGGRSSGCTVTSWSALDPQSGNQYWSTRNADCSVSVNSSNPRTGATWHWVEKPNGDKRGYESDMHYWTYEASTTRYYNYGTGQTCIGTGASRICSWTRDLAPIRTPSVNRAGKSGTVRGICRIRGVPAAPGNQPGQRRPPHAAPSSSPSSGRACRTPSRASSQRPRRFSGPRAGFRACPLRSTTSIPAGGCGRLVVGGLHPP